VGPGGSVAGFARVVKVFADSDDKIPHFDFDGNVGGCGY
jgi:hypothetical protein